MEVLIADDNEVALELLQRRLEKLGFQVVLAKDGAEAWKILQSDNAPRFAILDFMMPVMNGGEVCRKIRAEIQSHYTYVILITALDLEQAKHECLEAGADDFVSKSCDRFEIEHRIRAGQRIVKLQNELLAKNRNLKELSSIVEQSNDAIFRIDLDGRILTWNAGAIKLFGYHSNLAIGNSISFLAAHGLQSELNEILCALHSGLTIQDLETKRLRIDGSLVDVSVVVSPIRDIHGKTVAGSVVTRNISQQKAAQKAARTAIARRDQFMATMSHELRNPMAAVLGASNLLNQQISNQDDREARDVIQRHVRHLARMLDQMFDFSKVSHDKIRLHKEPVDLKSLVLEIVECVQPLVDEKHQKLHLRVPEAALFVHGDVGRLQQAQVNLLTNASKFTPEGGTIEFELKQQNKNVEVSVRDNGQGIGAEFIDHIFEPFVQQDESLDRSRSGMGLGLPLVKMIIEAHQGEIEVISEGEHQGSEFKFRVPMCKPPKKKEVENQTIDIANKRLLVVEDNTAIRNMLSMSMKIKGFEVATAADGEQALDVIEDFRPDVALIDIGLPDMSGYEVAKQIRSAPFLEGLFLVALTGYGRKSDRKKSQAAGFDLHLVKPLDPDEILRAITAKFSIVQPAC